MTKQTVAFRSFANAPNKAKMQLMTINSFKNASLLVSIYGIFLSTHRSRRLCVKENQHPPGHHVTTALLRTATKETLVAAIMQCCSLRSVGNNHVVLQQVCNNANWEVK
jgi:hypothetical protein